jgi:dTDP-4-amino-4,6-dideoxygalactose transaminase
MSNFPDEIVERAARAAADWVRKSLAFTQDAVTEHWRGDGPVGDLEALLRRHYRVPYALAMNNTTNALLALGLASNLANQDVIVPPQSYGATYGPFAWLGCHLFYTEADADGNLCPVSAEALVTAQTRAIIATDHQGEAHDQRSLRALCDRHSLLYLSDAACALFSTRDHTPASSLADAWVVSFGMNKPLPCGEGAAVITRHRETYERLLHLTQHPDRWRREVCLDGWNEFPFLNARMHPLTAVIALELVAGRATGFAG